MRPLLLGLALVLFVGWGPFAVERAVKTKGARWSVLICVAWELPLVVTALSFFAHDGILLVVSALILGFIAVWGQGYFQYGGKRLNRKDLSELRDELLGRDEN